jgi:pantoate--beta-alanine ligase
MKTVTTIEELRQELDAARTQGKRVGFVPTMGFLHRGHLSLIRAARAENDMVLVSNFVNPLQFGAAEDLEGYPRDLARDAAMCEGEGVDFIFAPSVEEMYPEPSPIRVTVGSLGDVLCGRTRPGHFDGVATVVAKLFNIAGECRAYFGRKDAQQLVVIRQLARSLNFPVEVVGCATVREPDGLAMSSRNTYLGAEERKAAVILKQALDEAASKIRFGDRDAAKAARLMAETIEAEPLARLDYAAAVNPDTLTDLDVIEGPALLAVAAWVGKARLIDNVTVVPE